MVGLFQIQIILLIVIMFKEKCKLASLLTDSILVHNQICHLAATNLKTRTLWAGSNIASFEDAGRGHL